jgi:hypothetical protein
VGRREGFITAARQGGYQGRFLLVAQALVSQAAGVLAVQITIDPADLAAGVLFDDPRRTVRAGGGVLLDHAELHG